jgi:hypothetical protein
MMFYVAYVENQERMTPHFQKFIKLVNSKYGVNIPASLRSEFRKGSLPLMKYANILTFNTRAIVLYVSTLFGHPWIYPVFEITVLLALYYYMRGRHEALCRHLESNLSNYATTK